MLSLPLVHRELRVQSRRRATYDARLLWGLGAAAVLGLLVWYFPEQSGNGRTMFAVMHGCAALMLLIVAPLGAADAISREKREGTLGLLMLTNLTPMQVVVGKLATHWIRLLYFALMLFPFMFIPTLLGGIAAQDIFLSIAILFAIGAAGIAAGLIASSLCTRFSTAMIWAMIGALLLAWFNSTLVTNTIFRAFRTPRVLGISELFELFVFGPGLLIFPTIARDVSGLLVITRSFDLLVDSGLVGISVLWLMYAIRVGARRVANHAAGESRRGAAVRRRFLTPIVGRGRLRRSLSRQLNRNPLIWLEFRTAMRRASRWVIAGLVICVETLLLITLPSQQEFIGVHFIMVFVFAAFIAFKSCASFQEEKESGGFELLLVTPLTEERLLAARLWAVANYYSIAASFLTLFGLVGLSLMQASPYAEGDPLSSAMNFTSICASVFSAPVCGLYFSLRSRGFMPALGWTLGLAILAPLGVWCAVNGLLWMAHSRAEPAWAVLIYNVFREHWVPLLSAMVLYHVVLGVKCYRATLVLLRARQFVSIA